MCKSITIAVIGAGTIGRAVIESLLSSGFRGRIVATRRNLEKIADLAERGVEITKNNSEAASKADVVILSVKPTDVPGVLREIRDSIKGKLVISLAAALPIYLLKSIVPEARFVRAMPNVAVLVQESFTAYAVDEDVKEDDKIVVKEILRAMGVFREVEEKYMDAITGFSGSGPAYIAIVIESLMYAGLKVGLPRDLSLQASVQTVLGTAKLAMNMDRHIAELKDMVVTPGASP